MFALKLLGPCFGFPVLISSFAFIQIWIWEPWAPHIRMNARNAISVINCVPFMAAFLRLGIMTGFGSRGLRNVHRTLFLVLYWIWGAIANRRFILAFWTRVGGDVFPFGHFGHKRYTKD